MPDISSVREHADIMAVLLCMIAAWAARRTLLKLEDSINALTTALRELANKQEERMKDVYSYIDAIRSARDIDVSLIRERLAKLEGEHASCGERISRLEKK